MIKYSTALLVGAFLLTSCTPKNNNVKTISEKSDGMCVAGFVETTPGAGTLDIYFPSEFSPPVQSIEGVSIEVAQEISNEVGVC